MRQRADAPLVPTIVAQYRVGMVSYPAGMTQLVRNRNFDTLLHRVSACRCACNTALCISVRFSNFFAMLVSIDLYLLYRPWRRISIGESHQTVVAAWHVLQP